MTTGISGNLKTMGLAELFQWLSQGRKTGCLIIDNGEVRKKLYFGGGLIVASGSTQPREWLGHFLVSRGYITEPELSKAVQTQTATGMLLGKILVKIHAISEDELRELLVLKTQESVYDLFAWKTGEFRFSDNELLEHGMIPLALDVTELTLQGINRLDEWKRIRDVIPSQEAVPVAAGSFADLEIETADRRILDLVDGQRSIHDIVLETHSNEFHVSHVLFEQYESGRVQWSQPRQPPPSEMAVLTQPTSAQGLAVVSAAALLESAQRHLDDNDLSRALRHLRAARSLEPSNAKVVEAAAEGENTIRQAIQASGLTATAVLALNVAPEAITSLQLTPEEGFLLMRIDGSYDLSALIKISPLDPLDAQVVLWKLFRDGHIVLKP